MSANKTNSDDSVPTGIKPEDLAPAVDRKVTPLLNDADYSRVVHVQGDEQSGTGRRILLAYDTTADGELAFAYTRDKLAQAGDHVFIATILPLSLLDADFLTYAPEYSLHQDIELLRTMNANAMKHLREKAAAFKAKGIDVSIHVAHGDARYSLVKLAEHHKADLIVLGRRKLGRFQKLISPASVSSYVLTHSECSCVIVKE